MDSYLRTQIGRLSGGQRRRVFLARALAAEPDLFLLDEPVTGIDTTTQELLMDILEAQAARGKTVVATTHDLACAAQRFQQVLAVNRTVVAYGPSNLVLDADVLSRGLRRPPARARGRHRGPRRRAPPRRRRPGRAPLPRQPGRADGLAAGAARLPDHRPRPHRLGAGGHRVRGRGHLRRPARHRVHRRRHRPRRVPGRRGRVHRGRPVLPRARRSRRSGTALAIGFVSKRAGLRQDTAIGVLFAGTFAFGVFLFSAIKGYVA